MKKAKPDAGAFTPPDDLRTFFRNVREEPGYFKHYREWRRHGPNDVYDEAYFDAQWAAATPPNPGDEDGRPAVEKLYNDERLQRQNTLLHIKATTAMLIQQFSLMFAIAAVVTAGSSPGKIQAFLQSPWKYTLLLLLAAWLVAASSDTPKILYTLFTHFMGVAHLRKDVTGSKSYVNSVRKEVNNYSRKIQKARRRQGLAIILINAQTSLIFAYILFG